MSIKPRAWVTLCLTATFGAFACSSKSVECTFRVCGDSFVVRVLESQMLSAMPGTYELVVDEHDVRHTMVVVADGNDGIRCEGDFAGCDDNGQLWFNLTGDFNADDLPGDLTFRVYSGSTLLGSTTLSPDYHRYWCNGPDYEECNDWMNYDTEVTVPVSHW